MQRRYERTLAGKNICGEPFPHHVQCLETDEGKPSELRCPGTETFLYWWWWGGGKKKKKKKRKRERRSDDSGGDDKKKHNESNIFCTLSLLVLGCLFFFV